MATVSSMFRHIDSLVLDYIDRRPKQLFQEIGLGKRGLGAKCLEIGLTLEEIYCHYFKRNLPSVSDVESSSGKNSFSDYQAMPVQKLPNLSMETIDQILKYSTLDTLLNSRVVSRKLNILSSWYIRNWCATKPVELTTPSAANSFLSTLGNRISSLGHPLGTYKFNDPSSETLSILDLVGTQIRIVEVTPNILKILEKMPNLRELYIMGDIALSNHVTMKENKHFSLRIFKLFDTEYFRAKEDLLEYLQLWLQIAPHLMEMSYLLKGSRDVDSVFVISALIRSKQQLKRIFVNSTCLEISQHGKINLSLSRDNARVVPFYDFYIAPWVDSIQSLAIRYDFYPHGASIPNLNSLTLHIWYPILTTVTPALYPALQHVTLYFASNANGFFQSYKNTVFPTVNSLSVMDPCWRRNSEELPIFHVTFPGVKALSLGGHVGKYHADYFANNFPEVTTLNFFRFDSSVNLLTGHTVLEKEEVGLQWPFSKLKNVRNMEFEITSAEHPFVADILNMTLKKCLPPLDNLAIKYWSPEANHVTQVMDAQALFYSMRQLNYHKNLMFEIIKMVLPWSYL